MFRDPVAGLTSESNGHPVRLLSPGSFVHMTARIPGFPVGIPTLREFKAFFP